MAHDFASPLADDEPKLSVVVPLFNEAENIPALYERLVAVLEAGPSYELVFVDDGSSDASVALLEGIAAHDGRVVVLCLSRKFGHQAAVSAGLDHALGAAVVVMDGDLQDPPELIPRLVALWREGHEVVYAVRQNRKESILKRAGYHIFYRLLRKLSEIDIPLDSGDFCLMDRKVVDVLCHLPERLRFVRGLRTFAGFRQVGLPYDRDARANGASKYSFGALVKLAVDGLVSFSSYPLHLVTYLGVAAAGIALALSIWVLADALGNHTAPRGWASTIVVVLFMSAIQLISLGIMGEYVRRIFIETKGRPTYIVRSVRKKLGASKENDGRSRPHLRDDHASVKRMTRKPARGPAP